MGIRLGLCRFGALFEEPAVLGAIRKPVEEDHGIGVREAIGERDR